MKPEKIHLIHDLLDNQRDVRRESTLLAGGRILRRRRLRRVTLQMLTAVILLGISIFSLQKMSQPAPHIITAMPASPSQLQSLTDDELLALFPETPVALVTLENGKKRLIFPRRGDEARFTVHLKKLRRQSHG